MRILFLCGSFEPGRDGVGDYTRRLAEELLRRGDEVAVAAIHDSHRKSVYQDNQFVPGELAVLRVPAEITKQEWLSLVGGFVQAFDPEWISLQYVPFSFHPKGLSFSLARKLKAIGAGRKWEIMFHEICVGMHAGAGIKLLLWGWVQQQLALDLLSKLKPALVHTHVSVYQQQLEQFGVTAGLLPLFSNIPLRFPEVVKAKLAAQAPLQDPVTLLIFASIQEGAPIAQLAAEAKRYQDEQQIGLRLLIIGRSGKEQEHWVATWKAAGLEVVQLGEQSEEEISKVMAGAAFGIFTTPLVLAGKSGAVAAMREHGINLMGVTRNWVPRGITASGNPYHLATYHKGNLRDFLSSTPDFSNVPTVVTVAEQFSRELSND